MRRPYKIEEEELFLLFFHECCKSAKYSTFVEAVFLSWLAAEDALFAFRAGRSALPIFGGDHFCLLSLFLQCYNDDDDEDDNDDDDDTTVVTSSTCQWKLEKL